MTPFKIESYEDFLTYVERLGHEHIHITKAIRGSYHRLAHELNNSDAPNRMMLIEWPDYTPQGRNGTDYESFRVGVSLLSATKQDDWAEQESEMNLMLNVVRDVIARVRHDYRTFRTNYAFEIGDIGTAEPITGPTLDNLYGWRFTIDIHPYTGFCYDPSKWVSDAGSS